MTIPDWLLGIFNWFGSVKPSDWIQVLIATVAVGASIVALVIAQKDRQTQLKIARMNREHSRLILELDYVVRLSANRNRGGSTDERERKQMGAEALALAGVVGERWVPKQWEDATDGKSLEEMKAILEKGETAEHPEWVLRKIETFLGMQGILDQLHSHQYDKS